MGRRSGSVALVLVLALSGAAGAARTAELAGRLDAELRRLEPRVVEWRRDIHRNPELSNREFRTSKLVAAHLHALGLEVETGVAHTGVVALLRGGRPGPTIALRADMDALPVTEQVELPFRSRVTTEYRGEQVGVMHACGHDAHTAILMGVAEALSKLRAELPGSVLFVFQPAEEGAPAGEEGGAALMLKEGLFRKHRPEAAFGLHMWSPLRAGELGLRSGPMLAASDSFRILVRGRQTHGARPWQGVDPIVAAAQIIGALQSIVSRELDLTDQPAVLTIGAIRGGVRFNIIPDSVEMLGTLRTFTPGQREQIVASMQRIVAHGAEAAGATAELVLDPHANPVTVNDPALTQRVRPVLERIAGRERLRPLPLFTVSEDFAHFAREVPSVFFFVGAVPPQQDLATAPANHSPLFFVDEQALALGARALAAVALDHLQGGSTTP